MWEEQTSGSISLSCKKKFFLEREGEEGGGAEFGKGENLKQALLKARSLTQGSISQP